MSDPEGVRPTDSPRATVNDIVNACGNLKRVGSQHEGPCPCCGGENRFHVNVEVGTNGDPQAYCRQGCSYPDILGKLGLKGAPVAPAPARKSWQSWWWHTASGKKRQQFRVPPEAQKSDGRTKTWAKRRGPDAPMPRDLLYIAHQGILAAAGPVYLTEGASSADSIGAQCVRAIGFPGAKPSPESLARLPAEPTYVVWPDHDGTGYQQAAVYALALTEAGYKVAAVDPVKLCGGEPPAKWDAGDWRPGDNPPAELHAATVDVGWLLEKAEALKPAKAGPVLVQDWTTVEGISQVLSACGYAHRLNVRAYRAEVRTLPDGEWHAREDTEVDYLRSIIPAHCTGLDADGIEQPLRIARQSLFNVLNAHAHVNQADPFRDYLEELPEWDGAARPFLQGCFPSLAADPFAEWASRSVTVGAIRRAFEPGARHQEMPVLQGAQGVGKSAALAWLFPAEKRLEWFTDDIKFSSPDKVKAEALQGKVLAEFSEMAGATRSEVNTMKAFMTRQDDGSARFAFRRDPTPRPRRAVFAGTTNDNDSLPNDPTGLRRWVPLEVAETDQGHVDHVTGWLDREREQVWAEALARYKRGEGAHLPQYLKGPLEERAERHRNVDEANEELVDMYMRQHHHPTSIRFADLLFWANQLPLKSPPSGGMLTLALKAKGWESKPVRVAGGKQKRRWAPRGETVTPTPKTAQSGVTGVSVPLTPLTVNFEQPVTPRDTTPSLRATFPQNVDYVEETPIRAEGASQASQVSQALDGVPEVVTDLERFTTMDGRNLDLQAFKRAHPSPLQLVSIDALIRWLIEHDDMSRETAHAVVGDRLLAALNTPQRES